MGGVGKRAIRKLRFWLYRAHRAYDDIDDSRLRFGITMAILSPALALGDAMARHRLLGIVIVLWLAGNATIRLAYLAGALTPKPAIPKPFHTKL